MIVDLVTGWLGRDLAINEFVYDSFVFVVLGLAIASYRFSTCFVGLENLFNLRSSPLISLCYNPI